MDSPRLSIIIATWNAAKTLERCLSSIENQACSSWELLIWDGGSTDATLSIIEKHQSVVTWWESAPDNGIYDAWNLALAHARGEYVCFLGADDALVSDRSLETLFTAIENHPYDLVTSRGRVVGLPTEKPATIGHAWDYQRIGRRMVVCHPGLLHRRTLFDTYGLFDSNYRITGDLDFLLRLPESVKTLHVDAVTVEMEAGGVSRQNVLTRLREQRIAMARCPRYGPLRARIAWLDKLWRYPIARILGIPH
ncbi:MAG: glycosyltransferase [Xanthomonadaceae bacterium]|nr:glycosyltransferase [Xanthomonadaceae bacterium]